MIIERSVKFDEPLQEVELVKEKIAEFPSYSTKYLDDVIGGDDPDLDTLISDIIEQKKLDTLNLGSTDTLIRR